MKKAFIPYSEPAEQLWTAFAFCLWLTLMDETIMKG